MMISSSLIPHRKS